MAAAGVDIFTFHVEVTSLGTDLTPFIQRIKSKNIKVGLAVKPGTSIDTVFPYLPLLDQVLVMTVEPGFGGQKFMADMMEKVNQEYKNILTHHSYASRDKIFSPCTTYYYSNYTYYCFQPFTN